MDQKYYELRVYYCHPGRLDALVKRFQDHTTRLFEKHGMENVGYWLPTENKDHALYYVLAYPNAESREASWKAFQADPEWKAVAAASETDGKIIQRIESTFMKAADISPLIRPSGTDRPRSFELRIYTCFPGRLDALIKRFRDHTRDYFMKHGMTNIAYWTTLPKDDSQPELVYLLAYPDEEKGKASWVAFRNDPGWLKVKEESEKDEKIVDHIRSVFLKPLPFSRIR